MTNTSFKDPYLQSILEKISYDEGFELPRYSISWGTRPGDNYCSRVYRTVITETNKFKKERSLSLLFKVSPLSETRRESTKTNSIFCTEADVYQTVLPALNNLLNKYGVVNSDIFPGSVRCFACALEDDTKVIVLEDKVPEGFCTAGETKSLDAEHCRQILRKMALWHASSLALQHFEPETAEHFKKLITKPTVLNDVNCAVMHEMKHSAFQGLTLLLEPLAKGSEAFTKLEKLVNTFEDEMAAVNEIPQDCSPIIHGDCWFTNVLYKYENGTLKDICLIDFQTTRFASPAADLSYMFFLCTTKDTRDASYNDLIRFYHDEVSSHLRKMDCDPETIISWELLQEHLRKYGRIGVLVALSGLQVCLVDSSENNVNLESADNDETVFAGRAKTSNPKIRKEIQRRTTDVIIDALRWGYI